MFGTDGSREDFSSVGGFDVAGPGIYLPVVMLDWSVALLLCLFRMLTILNMSGGILTYCCVLLSLPLGMSGWLVRNLLLVNVS